MARMDETLTDYQAAAAEVRDKKKNEIENYTNFKYSEFEEEVDLWFRGDIMQASANGELEKVEELMAERKRCLGMWKR